MSDAPNVMFGMSFFNNHDDARRTSKAFARALGPKNQIVLALETGLSRNQLLPGARQRVSAFVRALAHETWPRVCLWDKHCTKAVLAKWPKNLPRPFYAGFSYGAVINRLLILAKVAGCDFLVRVDPGTAPPYYLKSLIRCHTSILEREQARVVSGQYTDRIALRDHFVSLDRKEAYYSFIEGYTGVNPRNNEQLTGGAGLTIAPAGPPSIPFDGAPVWASDDGFFRVLLGEDAVVVPESRIPRAEAGGHAREGIEYPVRLASMVVLNELFGGANISSAGNVAQEFLWKLPDFMDAQHRHGFSCTRATRELQRRVKVISQGYKNYDKLRRSWGRVLARSVRRAKGVVACYP